MLRRLARVPRKTRFRAKKLVRYPLAERCTPPAFLIIGAQKSGTTSLFRYLCQHPDILAPLKKEIDFFDRHWSRGWRWYATHFPLRRPGKITGEASTNYLFHPACPARVRLCLPDVRLIVILRDPVLRAFSHYQHERRGGNESRPFTEALTADTDAVREAHRQLAAGEIDESWVHLHRSYAERGHYAEQLARWREQFPLEQLYVTAAERFYEQPAQVCAEIFDFLGVPRRQVAPTRRHNAGRYSMAIPEADRRWLEAYYSGLSETLARDYGVHTDWRC